MARLEHVIFARPQLSEEIRAGLNTETVGLSGIPFWEATFQMGPAINQVRNDIGISRLPLDDQGYIISKLVPCPGSLIPRIAGIVTDTKLSPLVKPELRAQASRVSQKSASGVISWHTSLPFPVTFINADVVADSEHPDELVLSDEDRDEVIFTHFGDSLNPVRYYRLNDDNAAKASQEVEPIINGQVNPEDLIIVEDYFERYVGHVDPEGTVTLLRQIPITDPVRNQIIDRDTYLYNSMVSSVFQVFMAIEMKTFRKGISWEEAYQNYSEKINQTTDMTDTDSNSRVRRAVLRYMHDAKNRIKWIDYFKLLREQPETFFDQERKTLCGQKPDSTDDWERQRMSLLEEIRLQRSMKGLVYLPLDTEKRICFN